MTAVEKIKKYIDRCPIPAIPIDILNSLVEECEQLEKQQLQDAWDSGHEKGYNQCEKDEHGYSLIEPDYETFNNFYSKLKGE